MAAKLPLNINFFKQSVFYESIFEEQRKQIFDLRFEISNLTINISRLTFEIFKLECKLKNTEYDLKNTKDQLLLQTNKNLEKDKLILCCICMNDQKNIVLYPCRHLCVCSKCIGRITKCPICRASYERGEKIFI